MATGIIACMGSNQTVSYTAQNNCKVSFLCATTGTSTASQVTVNGSVILRIDATEPQNCIQQYMYLGAGQTIFVRTDSSAFCVISCYEG